MAEWSYTTVGEQATLQRGFDITRDKQRVGIIPVISSGGVSSYHDKAMVCGPGVVLGRKGVVGSVFYIVSDYWPHDTSLWVKDFHGNDRRFVYYFFKNLSGSLANLDVGSANPTLNRNHVHPLPTYWPKSVTEQQSIASTLGALDDKIELNRQMNETLEAMARAIFKDWFVEFGPTRAKMAGAEPYLTREIWNLFPDRLDQEGKPDGWNLLRLNQIAEQIKGSITPTSAPKRLFEHYSLPAFDNGQNPAADFGETIMSNKTPIPEDAVLLSKLNPETSRVWIPDSFNGTQQISSTEFLVFQAIPPAGRGLLYCLFSNVQFKQMLEGMVTGTSKSHQRISPPALLDSIVLIGSRRLFAVFEETIGPVLLKLLANRENSRTLAAIRDLLLPKLMSSEIRVRDDKLMTRAALAEVS